MNRLFPLMLALCLIAACSSLPALQPGSDSLQATTPVACRAVFPQGKWQLTHTIEAGFPGGGGSLLVGVTVVDAPGKTIDCALMTVEGFVLFQAHMGRTLQVTRAVPPFDRAGFAAGIVDDLRLMFIEPAGEPVQTGLLQGPAAPAGEPVCRYRETDGSITDVRPGKQWRIGRYTPQGRLTRTVMAEPDGGQAGFPGCLRLRAPGPAGYTLEMKLIDAVRIDD